jgi:hypothetical protein
LREFAYSSRGTRRPRFLSKNDPQVDILRADWAGFAGGASDYNGSINPRGWRKKIFGRLSDSDVVGPDTPINVREMRAATGDSTHPGKLTYPLPTQSPLFGFARQAHLSPLCILTRSIETMTKLFVTLPALALVVALSASAVADNGISQATLRDMGLAGIQLMSDADAMAIRGMGYDGGHRMPKPSTSDKPWVLAFGVSFAKVEKDHYGDEAAAGTIDGFIAEGKFMAMGSHGSEAGWEKTEVKILEVKGLPATKEIHTKSLRVFAGGFATGQAL